MRVLILIALLFTFTSGSFADTANASSVDHFCSHHKLDYKNHEINDAKKATLANLSMINTSAMIAAVFTPTL
tara:strand:+ start:240 stop:455 length:216 start_codon:yes stop_codon:yes gene_type:complete